MLSTQLPLEASAIILIAWMLTRKTYMFGVTPAKLMQLCSLSIEKSLSIRVHKIEYTSDKPDYSDDGI